MAAYQLTNQAFCKIEGIYEYSIFNFGLQVAQTYVSGLHDCFTLLVNNQSWGSTNAKIKINNRSDCTKPMTYVLIKPSSWLTEGIRVERINNFNLLKFTEELGWRMQELQG